MKRKIFRDQADFAQIRKADGVYVDKTKDIYDCFAHTGKYFFLARPRRFGKSLLCTTLRELFLGNKKLFKGLWIEKSDWLWDVHPVIHLDMTKAAGDGNNIKKMTNALRNQFGDVAKKYGVKVDFSDDIANVFERLIVGLCEKTGKEVVVIIDEYDKPILDLVNKPDMRKEIHSQLRDFYAPLKPLEKYLRFVFLTGVYKFTQTSIFSNLNNLQDLTFDRQAGTLIGYTESELKENFSPEIKELARTFKISEREMVFRLRENYNGYRFGVNMNDGSMSESVYNSFAMNNVFAKLEMLDKWFESGSPTFLIKKIEEGNFEVMSPEGSQLDFEDLKTSCDPDAITAVSLLYYAGYATMRDFDPETREVRLGYPNLEVSRSTAKKLVGLFQDAASPTMYRIALKIAEAVRNHRFDELKELFNTALAQLTHRIIVQKEKYFQMVILLILQMGRLRAEAEIPTNDGSMDIVIEFAKEVVIVEVKFNKKAIDGLKQIKTKDYAKKYRADRKKLTAVGLSVAIGRGATKKSCVVDVAHEAL